MLCSDANGHMILHSSYKLASAILKLHVCADQIICESLPSTYLVTGCASGPQAPGKSLLEAFAERIAN